MHSNRWKTYQTTGTGSFHFTNKQCPSWAILGGEETKHIKMKFRLWSIIPKTISKSSIQEENSPRGWLMRPQRPTSPNCLQVHRARGRVKGAAETIAWQGGNGVVGVQKAARQHPDRHHKALENLPTN